MTTTPARRVASIDDLERAGDYTDPVNEVDGDGNKVGRGVWFLLPIHKGDTPYDRPTPGSGLHRVSEPPWIFTEHDDGSLEIRESIACGRGTPDGEYWHGYLDRGNVWRQV